MAFNAKEPEVEANQEQTLKTASTDMWFHLLLAHDDKKLGNAFVVVYIPSAAVSSSLEGLKFREPAMASAETISGEATNAWVAGLPSLRLVKLLHRRTT
jgi:hypothetical protein